jgi:hypothetical protein
MNWEGHGGKLPWIYLMSYPSICLEELGKNEKNINQGSRSQDQDSNLVSPRHISLKAYFNVTLSGARDYEYVTSSRRLMDNELEMIR